MVGMIVGFGCVVISIMTTGNLMDFVDVGSVFVVFGGVLGATIASYSSEQLKSVRQAVGIAMKREKLDIDADIDNIISIANVARRDGLLALEEMTDSMQDPFLKKGIMLVVDGSDPELIQSIMETDLALTKERHANNRGVLDSMAAYAPAFGMIGTLIGLINMLKSLNDMSSLGSNMSVALVTTFYGSMLANLLFSPLSKRLKTVGNLEYLRKELILEGILAIQNGENPRAIKEKLYAFLANAHQQKLQESEKKKKEG